MNLDWIVKAADARWIVKPEKELEVSWIASDLGEVRPGCLYLELMPDSAAEAVAKGAAAVISDRPCDGLGVPCAVSDGAPYDTLCRIASWYRRQFHTRIITIAGADGKTTVREMLYRILSEEQKTSRTRWELTGDLGVPETLLGLDADDRCAVVEMGFTTPGSFERLGKICRPSAAIITGIGSAHLGSFGNKETILKERMSLTRAMSSNDPVILCADDPMLYNLAGDVSGDVLYYGIETPCDVNGKIISSERDATVMDVSCYGKTTRIRLQMPGIGNCYNALAAFAAAVLMGVPETTIQRVLERFRPLPGRLSLMTTSMGVTIIDDSWTSTPESVREAADYFAKFDGKRKIAVLGEMEDLGNTAASAHRAAGRRIAQAGADIILVCGEHAAEVAEGAAPYSRTRVQVFQSPEEIAQYLRTDRRNGDVLLFKGGRKSRLETVIRYVYHDRDLRRAETNG